MLPAPGAGTPSSILSPILIRKAPFGKAVFRLSEAAGGVEGAVFDSDVGLMFLALSVGAGELVSSLESWGTFLARMRPTTTISNIAAAPSNRVENFGAFAGLLSSCLCRRSE